MVVSGGLFKGCLVDRNNAVKVKCEVFRASGGLSVGGLFHCSCTHLVCGQMSKLLIHNSQKSSVAAASVALLT